jgi:outer membrane translocation and assembly module TamA
MRRKWKKKLHDSAKPTAYFCCLIVAFFSFVLMSCTPERKLKESEYLLVKNKVTADKKDIPAMGDIAYTIRPRVNRRVLGMFLWKVSLYQAMAPKEKPVYNQLKRTMRNTVGKYPVLLDTATNDYYGLQFHKFRSWLQTSFGEAPVLLDTSLIEYSLAQISLMMYNRGYFDAKIEYSVRAKKQRATVVYRITAGEPYRIQEISYQVSEPVAHYIYQDTTKSSLQRGSVFNVQKLEDYREKITELLLNSGYYNFSKNYIRYEVDSNLRGERINLRIIVTNPVYQIDDSTIAEGKHRCYVINTIHIFPDFSQANDATWDSVYYTEVRKKTNDTNTYLVSYPLLHRDYRPAALVYPILFAPGNVYSNRLSRYTYDRYTDMHNFNFIKIAYAETIESKQNFMQDTGYLHCQIQLIKGKRQGYGFDLSGKKNGGIFGVGGEFHYQNKNLFKRAEIFSFTLQYTQELRIDSSTFHFRNFELGSAIMLEFPRFLFPLKQAQIPKSFRPKTWMSLGANYLKQDLYARFLVNLTFSYEWTQWKIHKRIKHSLALLDFNLIKMYRDSLFDATILDYGFSKRVMERYKDHFLLGTNYKITLQESNRYVFWLRFDLYGNLLYSTMNALYHKTEAHKNEYNQYMIWGIPFASGTSLEFDFVYHILQNKRTSLVYHVTLGIGATTLNSSVLPFEKSFYVGGSNSMRGWSLRALGPGSYVDTTGTALSMDRIGDMKIETNLEYRIPIYKILHLGLFIDAGNIWVLKPNDALPHGEFTFSRFLKEIAVDAGIGIRFDLSFFVIRLDYAVKVHDPGRSEQRWRFSHWTNYATFKSDRAIVLGIGYPF